MAIKTYSEVVLEDAPRFFSLTDEASGNFTDDTRFGHDMVVEDAPTFSQSMASGITGALYDGSNDMHVLAQTAEYDDISYPFTMECWFKSPASTSASTAYAVMMLNSDESGGSAIWYNLLYLSTDGSNNLVATVQTKDASTATVDSDTTVLNKNETYHVVCVFNANNDRDLYINGTLVQNFTTARTSLNAAQKSRVSIGGFRFNDGASANFYNGTSGCPAVYNFALSAERIRIHHAVGRGFTNDESYGYQCVRRAPTLFWETDETSGTTIADSSGWGHDGTSAGTPTLNQTGPGTQKTISFDGVDDKVGLDGATAVDVVVPGPYPYTDVVWMRSPDSTSASTVYGRSGIFNDGAGTEFFALYMQANAGNTALNINFQAQNTTPQTVTVSDIVEIGEYAMLASVHTSATDRKYYVNGVLVGSSTASVTFPTGADSIDIGVYDVTSGPFFGAAFIGLRSIHPIALTADDIREMHVAGRDQLTSTVIGNVIRKDAPQVYLKLDETSGTTAADSSAFAWDFTHSGSPTLEVSGVTYDGVDDNTKLSTPIVSTYGYPQTWMAVIASPASTSASSTYTFISSADEATNNNNAAIWLSTDGSNNLLANIYLQNSGTVGTVASPAILSKGTDIVIHYVMASATDRRMYINGALMATDTTSVTFPSVFDNIVLGGQDRSSGSQFFAGAIKEFALFEGELTTTQIREHVSAWQASFSPYDTLSTQTLGHAPLVYLPLDETSGTTAADASLFADDFTHNNSPTLSEDGATYNGTNHHTTLSRALVTSYPCTVAGIIKTPSSPGASGLFATISVNDNGADNNFIFLGLITDGSSNISARCGIQNSGTTQHADTSAGILQANTFYMCHAVYTSATDRKIYVNGVELGTNTTSLAFPSGLDNTSIGSRQTLTPTYQAGSVQDASFYNRALSASEIADQVAVWQSNPKKYGRKIHSFSPIGYFRCNEGSGATFADTSGWGNDLTVAGTPTLDSTGPIHNETVDGCIGDGDATNDEAATPTSFTMPTPSYPFAVSGWIASPASTVASTAYGRVHIGDDGTQANTFGMDLLADGSNAHLEARMLFTSGGSSDHNTSIVPKERDVFHHFLYVARSATDREVYLNGNSEITDATSATIPSGMDTVALLRSLAASPTFFGGRVGEVSFHSHSFTDANALDLYLAAFEAQAVALLPMGTINETGTLDNILGGDVAKFVSTDRSGDLPNVVMPEHVKAVSSRQVVTIATSCGIIMEGRASVSFVVARTAEGEVSIIMDFDHAASFHTAKSSETGIIVDTDNTKTVNVDPGSTPATPVTPRYKFTPGRMAYIFTPPREGSDNEV